MSRMFPCGSDSWSDTKNKTEISLRFALKQPKERGFRPFWSIDKHLHIDLFLMSVFFFQKVCPMTKNLWKPPPSALFWCWMERLWHTQLDFLSILYTIILFLSLLLRTNKCNIINISQDRLSNCLKNQALVANVQHYHSKAGWFEVPPL